MPPPKKVEPPHKLVLSTNSIRNTTIAVDDDAFYYEVVTRFWHPNLTKIKKLDTDTAEMVTIAEIEREPGRETRLRFGGQDAEWIPASRFLQKESQKVRGGYFHGNSGVQYRWKTHRRQLQMIRPDSDNKEPLVVRHPHKRHFFFFRMSQHAYLEIKPEVVDSLDALIMSYLLVERRRRSARPRIEFKVAED
ncbi:hypothetical protein DFH11DRAFT_1501567 [Phellopilus nigrolimitatus]|nr:hypothetical protein DFH11DRAFT_1501567 [Phellopilus nigrolimitatus]